MRKIRGFLIKHRVRTLFRRVLRRTLSPYKYLRLNPDEKNGSRISKLIFNWGNRLKSKAKRAICGKSTGQGYTPVYEDPFQENPKVVPKGKMAVYVGQKDGEFRRILVPVIYCNHPLFGELLREAEEEFGYNHPAGGLTIPCPISEFENIKTQIAATRCRRQMMTWK